MPKSESNVIYTESNETPPLSEGISFDEFTDMITKVIKVYFIYQLLLVIYKSEN